MTIPGHNNFEHQINGARSGAVSGHLIDAEPEVQRRSLPRLFRETGPSGVESQKAYARSNGGGHACQENQSRTAAAVLHSPHYSRHNGRYRFGANG